MRLLFISSECFSRATFYPQTLLLYDEFVLSIFPARDAHLFSFCFIWLFLTCFFKSSDCRFEIGVFLLTYDRRMFFSYILEGSWNCWSAPSRSHQIFLWKETSVGSQVPAGITIQEHSGACHLLRAFSQDVLCFLVWVIGYWSLSVIFSLSQFIWWVSNFQFSQVTSLMFFQLYFINT